MPVEITWKLYMLFESTLKEHYVWIEDVYLTGILPEILDIDMVNLEGLIQFDEPNIETSDIMIADAHNLGKDDRIKLWHDLFD